MLQKIIQFSIRNKLIIGLHVLALIIWGIYALTKLPIDAVPDITNNQVLVITSSPSLGAPDVERFITVPIEQATRSIPGIIEQRSFSRFGLSLVTIVFNDDVNIYLARQQVNEKLLAAKQNIPDGVGNPEIGPLTTGLGEIFQYVVKAKPGYESKYDLVALRDVQDWIVRRQLLGTEGVADVSSFGGKVKQYEVAVNTDKLSSFKLTINDVYKALTENNQNTGGAYIEKGPNVLFIRSEGLVQNLNDINNIVVKHSTTEMPVLVKDVATVQFGTAIRYGATVYNASGEVAGAVVMMLKGENSSNVIKNVKKRIKEIKKNLPEGIIIEPFLDRTKMVNNAIGTVEQNLIEGALIVIFVLVLFLGNMRAGLIVASVIPLSMLFAIIMMNMFGVSGNLMSLGALDFGLLVDGAVIIVEAVMHKLKHHSGFKEATKITQFQMDGEVQESAGKMMNAAVFGQIIILIVYLPILTLQGIEGKMFKPMAQTVSFAIIGAFLLSLTYVPMMTALFMSKTISYKDDWAEKIVTFFKNLYKPVLLFVLKIPKLIVASSFVMFVVAVIIMMNMGGEFIPKLEEGDFAVDTRLLTGTSLTTTIETTQKSAKVLMDNFPEVEKVVTKIGAGEIPTDPMPVEAADMMVILKDKKHWTSAKTFDELAEKMSEKLQNIPGIATGFQFPVQMRFNELMTGARQDVVCKIFGDDLDSLATYADNLGKVIQTINGAKDLYIETVTGVPQMVISYNREAIARFGADVNTINSTIQAAYAGAVTGLVFEKDKRYDLVVRLNNQQKQNVDNIGNLMIGVANGLQVPLNTLANVELKDGPYQIQREDARRRITIGFNVRGRDVQSIVDELQQKVTSKIKFQAGYNITYGGQYENLQHATKRLIIAVPLALALILMMLYFAFGKLKYALLIFSAIPLSAIGGVFALLMRSMPFSISAGVGFIALFGVAVLNGIVLVSEMNKLKHEHVHGVKQIILQATFVRFRPVMMTAAVASLGFLPMALSNGAGAEVQRPLATVVIGGLITSTLLTLIALPCLYLLVEEKKKLITTKKIVTTALLFLFSINGFTQATQKMSLQEVTNLVLQNSQQIKVNVLQEKYADVMRGTFKDLPKAQITTELGQVNSKFFDSKISVTQSFYGNSYYKKQQILLNEYLASAKLQTVLQKAELVKLVQELYTQLQVIDFKKSILQKQDSLFSNYFNIAKLRFSKGESNLLEKTSLENLANQTKLQLDLLNDETLTIQKQLIVLMQNNVHVQATETINSERKLFDTSFIKQHPYLQTSLQQQKIATALTEIEKVKQKPEWFVGLINQSFTGWQMDKNKTETYYNSANRFTTINAGISVGLFNKAQKAKVEAAKVYEQSAIAITTLAEQQLQMQVVNMYHQYLRYCKAVDFYKTEGLKQANIISNTANLSYKNGQINYIEWSNLQQQILTIQFEYVEVLKNKQMAETALNYLLQKN